MVVRRGEIWWAELSPPAGSGPGLRHPVVVVQSDDFNRSLIRTVVAVVISSNTLLTDCPGNVYLPKKASKLPKDSVANVTQLVTIDKAYLSERVGELPPGVLDELEDGFRLSLAL